MKILHLSDLHFCSAYKRENIIKTKKILRKAVQQSFDHLVITGDISDNSKVKDYEMLKGMLKTYNLYDSKKTSIVIGNHDIFGGVQTAFDLINFPNRCRATNYKEKVYEFYDSFKELFDNAKYLSKDSPFPFMKKVENIVFIGINSILKYSRIRNPFASIGKISNQQLFDVSKEISNKKYDEMTKILLVHHHFYKNKEQAHSSNSTWNKIESYTLKLRGKKRVFRFLNDNKINLVLHGHSHENREYQRKGIQFLNAGASIDNFSKDAFYYMIELNANEFNYELHRLNPLKREAIQKENEIIGLPEFAK